MHVATEPVELLEDVVLPPLLVDGPDQKASARHRLAREGSDAMRDRAWFLPGSQYGTIFERPSGTCRLVLGLICTSLLTWTMWKSSS